MDDIPLAPLTPSPRPASTIRPMGAPGQGPLPVRRGFLYQMIAGAVGALAGVVPMAAGLAVYFDPLRRSKVAGKPIPVTALDAIPDATTGDVLIGQFPIIADRTDAWNLYPNERIGSVYLVVPKGGKEVKALNTICPHLGCAVDTQRTSDKTIFYCPCHTSSFTLDGQRIMPCVAPRSMDELECQVESRDGRYEVSVVYQNFLPGLAVKRAKS
jgi:menaquinol-cytochrome c reductase iron-sulfur subunit